MMATMMTMNIIMSLMFMMMNHPISVGSILLTQTITVSLITGNMNQNFWFSYILFLILVGGMLILFMYMTSIASNEKFKPNIKMIMITTIIPMLLWLTTSYSKMFINNNETTKFNEMLNLSSSLNKYINYPLSMTLLFLMTYLLLALIATVKISSFKQGSIRQMN